MSGFGNKNVLLFALFVLKFYSKVIVGLHPTYPLNEKAGLYDFNGREIIPCEYKRGIFNESKDNKYITANDYEDAITEYYDIKGNLLFNHKYDSSSHNVSDNAIAVNNGSIINL